MNLLDGDVLWRLGAAGGGPQRGMAGPDTHRHGVQMSVSVRLIAGRAISS